MPARRRISRSKVAHEISLKMELDSRRPGSEVKLKTKEEAEKVAVYWRDIAWPASAAKGQWPGHPYETYDYRESIKVEQNRNRLSGRFLAGFTVITRAFNANFIEFGTGPDKPGSHSPWGPDTPTPEFGPAGMTEHFFRSIEGRRW